MGEAKRRKVTGGVSDPARRKQQQKLLLAVGIMGVVAFLIAIVYVVTLPPTPESSDLPVAAPNADDFPAELDRFGVSIGSPDAPVVVREFADYQCPACAAFAPASQRLKASYVESGQVRLVFFDLPLRQHANAVPAAMAARCAGDQRAFWEMNAQLFNQQREWGTHSDAPAVFNRYARNLGLDERRFSRCMETERHLEAVEQSRDLAAQLRVMSTPTVLVDNIVLTQPGWGQLAAVIERELARKAQ
ncbi:MAG: DsbA family protein [Marinobacter sp.]|nr:DsbA family protein [Marinobacter sp.]